MTAQRKSNDNPSHGRRVAEGFGERLRIELGRIGWSQKDLADKLGTRQGTVSAWASGTIPDAPNLERLADVLGVDPGYLLFGTPRNSAAAEALVIVRDVLRLLDEDPTKLQALADDWAMMMQASESESPPNENGPRQ